MLRPQKSEADSRTELTCDASGPSSRNAGWPSRSAARSCACRSARHDRAPDDADWECPFRIHGAGISRVEFGYGIDSMQALTTALRRHPRAARRVGPRARLEDGRRPGRHLARRDRVRPLDPDRPRRRVEQTPGAPVLPRNPSGDAASGAPGETEVDSRTPRKAGRPADIIGAWVFSRASPTASSAPRISSSSGSRRSSSRPTRPRRATKPSVAIDTLDALEEVLISADVGVGATQRDRQGGRRAGAARREPARPGEGRDHEILDGAARPQPAVAPPPVVMIVGVNGTGKTTTVGKLARALKAQGQDAAGLRGRHLPRRRRRAARGLGAAGRRRHDPRARADPIRPPWSSTRSRPGAPAAAIRS